MDLDWYFSRPGGDGFDLGHDPFLTIDALWGKDTQTRQNQTKTCLYDHFVPLFLGTANAIKTLGGRLQIEAVFGDYDSLQKGFVSVFMQILRTRGLKNGRRRKMLARALSQCYMTRFV